MSSAHIYLDLHLVLDLDPYLALDPYLFNFIPELSTGKANSLAFIRKQLQTHPDKKKLYSRYCQVLLFLLPM